MPATQTTFRRITEPRPAGRTFDLAPGERVGGYTVAQRLARGGFGAVYAARAGDGGDVALKVLHADLTATDDAVQRFAREVEAVRRIDHPNVVRILDVGRAADGRPYFAMELLRGDDLSQFVLDRGRLAPAEALAILAPVCDALAAAHARGIVHRDVKPANVFVAEPGDRVVLLDFGVAKLLDGDAGLTTSRQAIGTPAFMAPEQAGGQVDARTDVYGLGALAFFMLTGAPPFDAGSDSVLMYLHLHARRERASTRAPVPVAVDDVLARAMHTSPARRFASPRALLAALRDACGIADPTAPRTRASVACHVQITAGRVGDAPAAVAIAAADALARVRAALAPRGFVLAVDAYRSQLWVRAAGPDPDAQLAGVRAAVEAAVARDRVCARVTVRADDAVWDGGRPTGGPLLDLWAWEAA